MCRTLLDISISAKIASADLCELITCEVKKEIKLGIC